MKLNKTCQINNTPYPVIDDDITLDSHRPGKAIITVKADQPLNGLLVFSMGYNDAQLKPWFIGYIEQSITIDQKQQRVIAREAWAVLQYPLPVTLRHSTLAQVTEAITEKTGLTITLGQGEYLSHTTPFFYNLGSGYHAIDSLKTAFKIPRFFSQQQIDGALYIGSWDDSHWQPKSAQIADQWFSNIGKGQRANIPAIPALRPGVRLDNIGMINSIRLTGATMALTWNQPQ